MPHWGNAEVLRQKTESAGDVVTKLDEEVERYLANGLSKVLPGIAFVGEEFGGDRSAERFWLCDPIDGTQHFIRGLPFCTTMLALVENGQIIFSVIYDFINDIAYHAEQGKGAYENNKPIRVSNRPITNSYISYEARLNKPEDQQKFLQLRAKVILLNTISAGYELAMVATGKLEARICFDPYGGDYDYAPGALLVQEAGGKVVNLGTDTYDYRNVNLIAANPLVHNSLTQGPDAIFPIVGADM